MVRGISGMRAGSLLALAAFGMVGSIDRRRVVVIDDAGPWPDALSPAAKDTCMSAAAVELQMRREREAMRALGFPLTDSTKEAARREREDRERERKARLTHPEGPCTYRATGSKRSRRRRRGRA